MRKFIRTAFLWGGFVLGAALAAAPTAGQHAPHGSSPLPKAPAPEEAPIRRTMEELHKGGGVPPGWKFQVPPGDPKAGRDIFVKLECFACHNVQGETFPKRDPKPSEKGPDLTGMGANHPAEYLFESILHPNRVIVSDPGFTAKDGLSIMPSYNHLLTLEEAMDLTAYLKSLTGGGHGGGHSQGGGQAQAAAPPAAPDGAAKGSFTEFQVRGGKLASGPKILRVKQGDAVRLRFHADKETQIHLHGYNVERKAGPGAPAEMVFRARAAGRFPAEAHAGSDGGGHGHGAAATLFHLEVHPR